MCFFCVAAAAAVAPSGAPPDIRPPFFVAKFVAPVLFSVGGFNVYAYGVFVAAALGIATAVFDVELTRAKISLDVVNCFFVFLFGFAVGSKSHLALSAVGAGEPLTWASLDIRTGHSFMGSQVGAVLCMLVYVRWNKVGLLPLLDVLLPCCLLGHTIGKFGCFFSGDGCYGPYADPGRVPWAMSFPNGMVPTNDPVHPTPLYEAACSFTVFCVSRWVLPMPQPVYKAGRRTAIVLVLYGIERVIVEQFRQHPPVELFGGLTEYQFMAVVLFLIGVLLEASVRWHAPGIKNAAKQPSKDGGRRGKVKAS